MKCFNSRTLPAVALSICIGMVRAAEPIPNSFSYQGHLAQNGESANGAFDLRFSMFNVATGGSPSFGTITLANTSISNGIFSTYLDFGPGAFDGSARWLEIGARPSGSLAPFTVLTPRQALTATPYAFFAQQAGSVANGAISNEKLASGAVTAAKLSTQAAPLLGQILSFGPSGLVWLNPAASNPGSSWLLNGNSGTQAGVHFIGTTDTAPLEFRVGNLRALKLWPVETHQNGSVMLTGNNVIMGYAFNDVLNSAVGATISGGGGGVKAGAVIGYYTNLVVSDFGTIAGGGGNVSGAAAFVGGGLYNSATNMHTVVAGGRENRASGDSSAIGGGTFNAAEGARSTVSGGTSNKAGGSDATIGGGSFNIASEDSASIAGGRNNRATGKSSSVAGGQNNLAGGINAVTVGGESNVSNGHGAFVGGGTLNTNSAMYGVVVGGSVNSVSGNWSGVLSGQWNVASGNYCMANGYKAKATHAGCFVWADFTDSDFASSGPNQFLVRAKGGVRFASSATASSGVQLAPGGGSWSSLSDRNSKTNLVPIDSQEILSKVAALPVFTWSYKSQPDSIRHIGPTAQDFAAAFKVGEDDKHIAAVDPDGVALAAIQGLNELVRTQSASLLDKERRIQELEKAVTELRHLIANRP
jgi:hypothetical protein